MGEFAAGQIYSATKHYVKMPAKNVIPDYKLYKDYKIIDWFIEAVHADPVAENPASLWFGLTGGEAFIHRVEVDTVLLWAELHCVSELKTPNAADFHVLNTCDLSLGLGSSTAVISTAILELMLSSVLRTDIGYANWVASQSQFFPNLNIPLQEMDCILPRFQSHLRWGSVDPTRNLITNHIIVGIVEK